MSCIRNEPIGFYVSEFRDQFGTGLITAAGNNETGALFRKGQCGSTSNPGQSTGNQNDFCIHTFLS